MATQVWPHDGEVHAHVRTRRVALAALDVPLLVIGRIIFGGFFLYSGVHHFIDRAALTGYAAAAGVPYPDVAIMATGALLILGGLGLITGAFPRLGAGMIMLFLIGVTPVMHAFWKDPAGPQRLANLANFTKNVALLGAAFIVASIPAHWGRARVTETMTRE